jgi:hypothetical protein
MKGGIKYLTEEELNYVVYPPKNFFVETECFLGCLSFMELENLYDEEYNSHPLISLVREIVQSEPSIRFHLLQP